MSSYPARDIQSALLRKGFRQDDTHHRLFWLYYVRGGRTPTRTRLSHGIREYGDSLLGAMAKELHLRRSELNQLIECPMDHDAYVTILVGRGFL